MQHTWTGPRSAWPTPTSPSSWWYRTSPNRTTVITRTSGAVTWVRLSRGQALGTPGGYVPHKGCKLGKIALCPGLQKLYDSMATIALLKEYKAEHGDLPPRIAALIQGGSTPVCKL